MTPKLSRLIQNKATKGGKIRCFNNNKINIESTSKPNISSGNTSAANCEILVVPVRRHKTVNLLGRKVL